MPLSALISTGSGEEAFIAEGNRLVFGRGPGVDLAVAAGRGLSRRAGVVTAMPGGAWIANISRTHALYVEGEGYRVRLPRLEDEEPSFGWFMQAGTAYVGSRAMFDDEERLTVTVSGHQRPAAPVPAASGAELGSELGTVLPLTLDPMTKLFLVALIWCRPWLEEPSATRPLPRTPEIARGALEVTGAYHELDRFDTDPDFRDLLSSRVTEHIKALRRKIIASGLARADVRLSDEVAVRILIDHGTITTADLGLLGDPDWKSRQEDLWWTSD